jgi:hypothetical protein
MDPVLKESSDVNVKQLLKQVRKKVTAGTVTTRDWRGLAASDPDVARKELASYLRSHERVPAVNPYDKGSKPYGAGLGFALGLVLTVVIWYVMPDLRSALKDDIPGFAEFATATMFAATFFAIVFAFVGARWGQFATPMADGSFEDMLRRFEIVQRDLRRV